MASKPNHVRPNLRSKQDVSAALNIGWARMVAKHGRGGFADAMNVDPKTISRALAGDSVPELHTALNSLMLDPTALNELFALYGLTPPRKREAEAANDLHTMTGLSDVLRAFCAALEDGNRDHRETLALADLIRPLMPLLANIVSEANAIKGVAA